MKFILAIIFFFFSAAAFAQNKINKKISDDGKLLKIKISGVQEGRSINYKNTFEVNGLSKQQRDSIVSHVMDFLGVNSGIKKQ